MNHLWGVAELIGLLACGGSAMLLLLVMIMTASVAEQMNEMSRIVLRPQVGESLMGQGEVVAHRHLIDSAGVFHGLCLLVIEREGEGYPDIDVWKKFLPTNSMTYAAPDREHPGRINIWYKLAGY